MFGKKTYRGSSDDWANSVRQTSDGEYIVVEVTTSFGTGRKDIYVIKLDAEGNARPHPIK
uniref:Uncharacterized protein n=1 Tax=Dictyoglomus thermophilum TaxID=14 RepID=A0A7C3MJA5_DICTH